MAFDNPSNRGRAAKIVEILNHVEKSAKSNRASEDEIGEILAPAVQALRALGAIPPAITPTQADRSDAVEQPARGTDAEPRGKWAADHNAPAWATIRDVAENASLPDLATAMAVFAIRMDAALDDLKPTTQN